MTSPHTEDDRDGLDLLAAAIDDVAAGLPPSNLVPLTPSETLSQTSSPAPEQTHRITRLMALAAAVLIALLAYPAYLGWVELPEVRQQLAQAEPPTGPVDLAWLSPPRQGERAGSLAPPTQLVVPASGSVVWLLELPPDLRPRLQHGAKIELRPTPEDAAVEEPTRLWSVDAESLADHLEKHDGVPLLLQAADLEPTRYRLQWLDPAGKPVSGVDLEVVKP